MLLSDNDGVLIIAYHYERNTDDRRRLIQR